MRKANNRLLLGGAPFNFGVSSDAPPKPTFNFTGVTASTPQAFNFSASSAAPTMGGGDAQSRVFHFGPSQTAPQTGPLATGGFAAGGFGSANMGMGIGGFGSSTSTSISSVGGGAGVFHFGAPAPQMQLQSTPNANAPFQFSAGATAPAANIFAFNPPTAGKPAQNSQTRRKIHTTMRRNTPR